MKRKLTIHKANEMEHSRWLQFQKRWFGFRFAHKGQIKSKAECFSAVENGNITNEQLEDRHNAWHPIESDYHLKKFNGKPMKQI